MNILYLLNYAGTGGSEKYIETLISELGERITPFFAYNEDTGLVHRLERMRVPCYRLPMSGPFDFKASRALAKLCRELHIDVVHTHFMRENFIAVRAKRLYNSGARVLNTVHMLNRKTGATALLNSLVSKGNIATVAVSDAVLSNLRQENVYNPILIYNGVDISHYSPVGIIPQDDRQSIPITVACIGRFTHEKGQEFLIKTAQNLQKLRFFYAGEGPDRAQLEQNAPSNCKFMGYLSDTRTLLHDADIYVCPSLEEALGLSVLEAMACGLCPVVTDVGGLPEIVTRDCGIVVPAGDSDALERAIRTLADDPELRAKLANAALQRVRTFFNLADTVQQTLELYA